MLDLALDASDINDFFPDPSWQGLRFGETVGVWAHPTSGTEIDFDAAGRVLDYRNVGNTSWDRANRDSTIVPEPTTAWLLGLGVAVLGLAGRGRRVA